MSDQARPEPMGLLPWVIFLIFLLGVVAGLLNLSVTGYLKIQ